MKDLGEAKKIFAWRLISKSIPMSQYFRLYVLLCPIIYEEPTIISYILCAQGIKCLMYVMVCTRSDIEHVVNVVSKYIPNLGKEH